MSASTGLRFINLNEVLLQISDKIDPDELERLKKLCYELQDGTNPLAISRRELADVKEAFDLFVLQYDHHKNTFLRNVISLVDRLRNSSKAAELTNLVFCWILRKTSIAWPNSQQNQSVLKVQAQVEDTVDSLAQPKFITELHCDFMGIEASTRL